MDPLQQPLIIKDWELGMADGPNKGNALLKNVSMDSVPGALMPQYAPLQKNVVALSTTFTANASNDTCTSVADISTLATGTAIQFTTTGTLPAGLATATDYYIIKLSSSTFKVATTYANSQSSTAIDITDAGTGVHTVATINLATPGAIADDLVNNVTYVSDSNQRIWYSENGGTLILLTGNTRTSPSGTGLAHFIVSDGSASYLFTFRSTSIDICNVTTQARRQDPVGTSSWSNSWQSTNGGGGHNTKVGQDNIIYFCDGRYVGSIMENAGSVFAPGTGGTYTFNNQALKLPQGEVAVWLEELDLNLLVAGQTYNKIYPWDRSSPSFGFPLVCAETGVYRLKNVNNTIIIFNGTRGNIYKTQGAIVQFLRKLPEYLVGNGSSNVVTWGGVANKGGAILFGVAATSTGQAGSSMSGIYSIWPDGRLLLENQLLTAGAAQVNVINNPTGEFYRFAGVGEFDVLDTNRYGGTNCVAHSRLYDVGNKIQKGKFSRLEVTLNQPLSGTIQVDYRTSLSASFTNITTFTTDATVTSFTFDCGLTDLERIQIQLLFGGTGSTTAALQILEVRLIP